jgi:hypothetical protein
MVERKSSESVMSLDDLLKKQDRIQRVHELWKSLGATDEQAITASATLAERFDWTGSVLNFNGNAATADAVREHFAQSGYAFLLPPETAAADKAPDVPADVLAAARAGSLTAKGRIFRIVKDHATVDALIAGKAADDTARDDKGRFVGDESAKLAREHKGKNPWAAGSFNVTEQGRIYRANPKLAASLAAAANTRIGATKATNAA